MRASFFMRLFEHGLTTFPTYRIRVRPSELRFSEPYFSEPYFAYIDNQVAPAQSLLIRRPVTTPA